MRYAGFVLLASVLVGSSLAHGQAIQVNDLRCEYLKDPLGVDAAKPRLSWVIESQQRGQRQTAYQVIVASSPAALENGQGDVWDSGKVSSDETAQIVYGGRPLVSRQVCCWKVRAWDRDGQPSGWSKPASLGNGALEAERLVCPMDRSRPAVGGGRVGIAFGRKWIWCPEPGVDLTKTAPAGRPLLPLPRKRACRREAEGRPADSDRGRPVHAVRQRQADQPASPRSTAGRGRNSTIFCRSCRRAKTSSP